MSEQEPHEGHIKQDVDACDQEHIKQDVDACDQEHIKQDVDACDQEHIKQDVDASDQRLSLEQQKVIETDLKTGDQKEIVSPGSEGPGPSAEVPQPHVEPLSIPIDCTSVARKRDAPEALDLQHIPHNRTTTITTTKSIPHPANNEEVDKDMVQAQREQSLILKDIRTAMHQVAQTIRQRHMQLTKVNSNLLRVLKDNAAVRRDMAAMGQDMAAQNNRITAIQGDILGVQRAMKDMITRVSEIITIQAQAAVAAMFPIPSTSLELEERDTPQPPPEPVRPRIQHQPFPPYTAASGNLHVPALSQRPTALAPIGSYYSISSRRIRQTKPSWRAVKPYSRGRGGRGGWGRGNGY